MEGIGIVGLSYGYLVSPQLVQRLASPMTSVL